MKRDSGLLINQKRSGTWKHWYNNGHLKAIEEYKNGEPVGVWKEFFDDGVLRSELSQIKGPSKEYYSSGNSKAEEDVAKGRVTQWNSVDEMFDTILGK